MIEKLPINRISSQIELKINELVDVVNELHEEAENNARIRADHEKQIDELQKHEEQHLDLLTQLNEMRLHQKKEPTDPYAEQRKALDVAVDKLKGIKTYYDDSCADPHFVNWHIVAQRLANDADDAIKAITALEQKDVK